MSTRYELHAETPLFDQVPEDDRPAQLSDSACRVGQGEDRMWFSFFCAEHARAQLPTSIALMVGGLGVVSASGEILSQGKLTVRR